MSEVVYILCALTSIACAVLLVRAFAASRTRLLLWSGLCFVGLATSNVVLFVDKVIVPDTDLSLARGVPTLAGLIALVYGLVWEAR